MCLIDININVFSLIKEFLWACIKRKLLLLFNRCVAATLSTRNQIHACVNCMHSAYNCTMDGYAPIVRLVTH